jgi:Domain of unknown function (DUF4372)
MSMWPLFLYRTIIGRCWPGVLKLHSSEVLGAGGVVCSKFLKKLLFQRNLCYHAVDEMSRLTETCFRPPGGQPRLAGAAPPKIHLLVAPWAMLFGQWSARKSLRNLVFSVNRQVRKCYHLGLSVVKRSTLADANQQRPAVIFEKTYYKLYERLSAELATQPQEAPKIKIIDATTIDLCASVFPWAKFRTRKGAIKLPTVLTEMLPQCVLVTDGKTHDRRAVQDLHFEPDRSELIDYFQGQLPLK